MIETAVSPIQRKNLAEIAKTLHQISTGRFENSELETGTESSASSTFKDANYGFIDESVFSKYLSSVVPKFSKFLEEASTVISSEEYFGMDEFYDSNGVKCAVYITPDEIVQVHHSLTENLSQLIKSNDDPLKIILDEMGTAPDLGSAAKGPGSEVVLNLTNRFGKMLDEQAPARKLLKETKKIVLLVIRFCSGSNLLDILEQVPTAAQEAQLSDFIKQQEASVAGSATAFSFKSNSPSIQQVFSDSAADLNVLSNRVYKNTDDSMYVLSLLCGFIFFSYFFNF